MSKLPKYAKHPRFLQIENKFKVSHKDMEIQKYFYMVLSEK